jgi:hypothetical protein
MQYLDGVGATVGSSRGRYTPTQYGRLLVSLPLNLESSRLVVRAGLLGFTWEGVMLASIHDTVPYPIVRPFR